MTDVQRARSEAAQRGECIRLCALSDPRRGRCDTLYTAATTDCPCPCPENGSAVCTTPTQRLKSQGVPASRSVSIESNVTLTTFSSAKGSVGPTGSIDLKASHGHVIRQVVGITTLARTCSSGQSYGRLSRCRIRRRCKSPQSGARPTSG